MKVLTYKRIVLMLIALAPVLSQAQTWEQWDYMENCKKKVDELLPLSQAFYNMNVKPVEQQFNAIPEDVSKEQLEAMHSDLQNKKNELASQTATFNNLSQTINNYISTLLNSRCNPQAVAALKDYHEPSAVANLEMLKNYESYSQGLREPLMSLRTALEQNGWRKLDESSPALQSFDRAWDNSSYINLVTNSDEVGIPFLNECVKKVISLRFRGFDNCRDDIEQLIANLTPSSDAATSPANYLALISNHATTARQINELNKQINNIENQLGEISDINEQYNELGQQKYEVVEQWYDMREEIDNVLMDACKYVLSQPCDTLGAFTWMSSLLQPLLDNVFHKSYKARRDRYVQLMADYDRHTTELGSFLKRVFVYSKAGQVTDETRNEISSLLHQLEYYKDYYVSRNEQKAVSSPYLDGVIYSFEQILSSGFTNGKEQLQTLSENLRGDELYYSTLENDSHEIKQGYATYYVNGVSFNMVRVKGGTFTMGATAEQGGDADSVEKPAHQVTLSSFMMGQTEVTQELWQAVMGSNPSRWKGPKLPVEQVSWDDCQEFVKKLNALTGQHFRLPTEAEWEYAARGGSKSQGYKYSGSNNLGDVAWYDDNSGRTTHDVATKQPNELGIYDMSGNVWEWCQDWYGENYYSSSPSSNPQGPSSGSRRVCRGGSWYSGAGDCRVAYRNRSCADGRGLNLGLRLAL